MDRFAGGRISSYSKHRARWILKLELCGTFHHLPTAVVYVGQEAAVIL